jgi:hypothetical protein
MDRYKAVTEYLLDCRADRDPSSDDIVFCRETGWKDDEEAVDAREGVCSMTDILPVWYTVSYVPSPYVVLLCRMPSQTILRTKNWIMSKRERMHQIIANQQSDAWENLAVSAEDIVQVECKLWDR